MRPTTLFVVNLAIFLSLAPVAGCGDDDTASVDRQAKNVSNNATNNTTGEPENNAAPPSSLTVDDQVLSNLSTLVNIQAVTLADRGFVVIQEDDGGAPGAVLGHRRLAPASFVDVEVALERPAESGETLHASLYQAAPAGGESTFDGGVDAHEPVVVDGAPVTRPFVVNIFDDKLPALRFTFDAADDQDFTVTSVEPDIYASWIDGGEGGLDPTLTLTPGWRYEFVNEAATTHPLEFVHTGSTSTIVLFSQKSGSDPTTELKPEMAWVEQGDTVAFTFTDLLLEEATRLDGYRCAVHPAAMIGDVVSGQ